MSTSLTTLSAPPVGISEPKSEPAVATGTFDELLAEAIQIELMLYHNDAAAGKMVDAANRAGQIEGLLFALSLVWPPERLAAWRADNNLTLSEADIVSDLKQYL